MFPLRRPPENNIGRMGQQHPPRGGGGGGGSHPFSPPTTALSKSINFMATYGLGTLVLLLRLYHVSVSTMCHMFHIPVHANQTLIPSKSAVFCLLAVVLLTPALLVILALVPWLRMRIRYYEQQAPVIGYSYLIICIVQGCWTLAMVSRQHWILLGFLLGIMMIAATILFVSQCVVALEQTPLVEFWLLRFPFSVHLGWLTAASGLNFNSLFVRPFHNDADVLLWTGIFGFSILQGVSLWVLTFGNIIPQNKKWNFLLACGLSWANGWMYAVAHQPSPDQRLTSLPFTQISMISYGAILVAFVIVMDFSLKFAYGRDFEKEELEVEVEVEEETRRLRRPPPPAPLSSSFSKPDKQQELVSLKAQPQPPELFYFQEPELSRGERQRFRDEDTRIIRNHPHYHDDNEYEREPAPNHHLLVPKSRVHDNNYQDNARLTPQPNYYENDVADKFEESQQQQQQRHQLYHHTRQPHYPERHLVAENHSQDDYYYGKSYSQEDPGVSRQYHDDYGEHHRSRQNAAATTTTTTTGGNNSKPKYDNRRVQHDGEYDPQPYRQRTTRPPPAIPKPGIVLSKAKDPVNHPTRQDTQQQQQQQQHDFGRQQRELHHHPYVVRHAYRSNQMNHQNTGRADPGPNNPYDQNSWFPNLPD